MPAAEEMFTMAPALRATMPGSSERVIHTVELTFSSTRPVTAASSICSKYSGCE